ncbi:hypothetical protein LOAG_09430, partial [Loa loa]
QPHRAFGMLLIDWIFLAGLGVAMAVLSLILDYGVDKLQTCILAHSQFILIDKEEIK